MPLRKIPENAPVEEASATTRDGDDDLLAPIKLAAQRSFERRRREAAEASTRGAGSLQAPGLRRTVSLPISGAYPEALRAAKSIAARLRLPNRGGNSIRNKPDLNTDQPSDGPVGATPEDRPRLDPEDILAPALLRTQSSPTRRGGKLRVSHNVRNFSAMNGEAPKYSFTRLMSASQKAAAAMKRKAAARGATKVDKSVSSAMVGAQDMAACPESALVNYALQLSLQSVDDDVAVPEDFDSSEPAGTNLKTVEELLQEQDTSGDMFAGTGDIFGAVSTSEPIEDVDIDGGARNEKSETATKKEKKKKEKKKKKKKKFSYKSFMKKALSSKRSTTEIRESERERIARNLGGGEFSKHNKL